MPDAADNYRVFVRFRDRLAGAASLEAAYVGLFRGEGVDVPPLFVHQLTQVLLRHVLGEGADPLEVRAAEMLFRPQRIAVLEDGAVMAADDATVELHATTGGFGSLGELLKRENVPTRSIDLDVLSRENAASYWDRDERFDLSVMLNRGQPPLDALCRVLERWIAHFLGVRVRIAPERRIDDDKWVWHVGLDAEASAILNDLYNRVDVDDERIGAPAVPVPPRVRGSRRHARGHRRAPGVPGHGDGRAAAPEAQAPEPPPQPAARAYAMNLSSPSDPGSECSWRSPCSRPPRWPARNRRRRPRPRPPRRHPATAADAVALSDLSWLSGCWRGSVNQREFREHWLPLRGNLLIGAGHTVTQDRTQDFEYVRIEPRADGVHYVAQPSAGKETAFRLADRQVDGPDTIFTFANDAHDFPQRIVYRRGTEGWLYIHVEGRCRARSAR